MHRRRRIIAPIVLLTVVVVGGVSWYLNQPPALPAGTLSATGTIEATTITVSPEVAGRASEVLVAEGDAVAAGDVLVRLDDTLVSAQRGQAAAAVTAAEAGVAAARANRDLLASGPSPEQLAVAQRQVDQARTAYEAARDAYGDLSSAAQDTPSGQAAKARRDNARASLRTAQAQYDLIAAGSRPEQLTAAEAQLEAALAQLEAARAALAVIDAGLAKMTLAAPVGGTILSRTIEPGETVAPGAALLELGDLGRLTLTVFVPEDRYGRIALGQPVTVTVDSFPGQTFSGTVSRIADEAEFTPRNVQTAEGRASTVFAIELALDPSDGKLRPGMPADVVFG